MSTQIGRTVLLTRDPDATAAFYRDAFGFSALYDSTSLGVRFLHVGPGGLRDAGLWLMPAGDNPAVGQQGGGGPFLVLYVDDLQATLDRLAQLGVTPASPAVVDAESGETYAEIEDPDGNGLILVELGAADEPMHGAVDEAADERADAATGEPVREGTAAPARGAPAEPSVGRLTEPTDDELATIPDLT